MTTDEWLKEHRKEVWRNVAIIKSGYAGTAEDGSLVDRREHPDATPVQENEKMGAPKPKELTQAEKNRDLIEEWAKIPRETIKFGNKRNA